MNDIRHSLAMDAPADRLRRLVGSADGLTAWWAEDVVRVPGSSALELGFFDRSTVYRLVLVAGADDDVRWQCETGHEWAGTELRFRLQSKGAQTLLEFTHHGWKDASAFFVSCNTVWGHLMFKLKDLAERGGPPRPLVTKSAMESSSSRVY